MEKNLRVHDELVKKKKTNEEMSVDPEIRLFVFFQFLFQDKTSRKKLQPKLKNERKKLTNQSCVTLEDQMKRFSYAS